MDITIKNLKTLGMYPKIAIAIVNTQTLKVIYCYTSVHVVTEITKKALMKN